MAYPRWLATGILLSIQLPLQAIELGDLELNSQLHQPLQAEIPFYLDEAEKIKRIKICLASQAQMTEAGITGHKSLPTIQAQRIGSVIKLSTSQVVNDPWLDFVLDISDGKQHLYQKYNLHLGSEGVAATVSGQAVQLKSKADSPQAKSEKPSINAQKPAAKASLETEHTDLTSKPTEPAKPEIKSSPELTDIGKTIALQDKVPPKHEHPALAKIAEPPATQSQSQTQTQVTAPVIPETLIASINENTQKLIEQSFNITQQRTEQLQQQINTVQAQQQQMLESNQSQHDNLNLLSLLALSSLLLGVINLAWLALRLKSSPKAEVVKTLETPTPATKKTLDEPKPKPSVTAPKTPEPEIEIDVVYTPSKPVKKREEPVIDLAAALFESDERFASNVKFSAPKPAEMLEAPLKSVSPKPVVRPLPNLETDVFSFDFANSESLADSSRELQAGSEQKLEVNPDQDKPKTKKAKATAKKKPAEAGS